MTVQKIYAHDLFPFYVMLVFGFPFFVWRLKMALRDILPVHDQARHSTHTRVAAEQNLFHPIIVAESTQKTIIATIYPECVQSCETVCNKWNFDLCTVDSRHNVNRKESSTSQLGFNASIFADIFSSYFSCK